MVHLFLDIETYISEKNDNSGLNPYEEESKIILISYNYYDGFEPPKKENIKPPLFLKEWESDEKDILTKFYNILKELKEKDKYLKFYGFNIINFDLPYLFGRMKTLKIAEEKEIYELLFKPFSTDLYQVSRILPSEKFKKFKQLWGVNQKEANDFFKIPMKNGNGAECSHWYDKKEYDNIIKYANEEFTFELLLDALYQYVLSLHPKE